MSFRAPFLLLLPREWATAVTSPPSQSTTPPMICLGKGRLEIHKGPDVCGWNRRGVVVLDSGVKLCGEHEDGCSCVTSTLETRSGPSHPKSLFVKSGECPVEFVYLWPTEGDKRRWITGIRRSGGCADEMTFHNHPLHVHATLKISSKVDTDIRRAVVANPHLKTKGIVSGKFPCSRLIPMGHHCDS